MRITHMDIRTLRHIVVLARELNYTRAAQALHVTQSALSRSIQTAELNTGLRLFDRDRGGVNLTPAGREFVKRAKVILREMDDLNQTVQQLAQGQSGSVTFGMAPLPARAILPAVLPGELANNPRLGGTAVIRNANALLALLLEEEIEFFLCAEMQLPATAPLQCRELGRFPLSLVVRPGHPLLTPSHNSPERDFQVIAASPFRDGSNFPPYIRDLVSGPPQIVVEDYSLLVQITEQSDAIWPTSTFAVNEEIHAGRLVEIPPPPGEPSTGFAMMLYWLDRRTLSPAAGNLIARISERIHYLETTVIPSNPGVRKP